MVSPAVTSDVYMDIVQTSLRTHVLPRFVAFNNATQSFKDEVSVMLEEDVDLNSSGGEVAYKKLVLAWSNVQHLRVGPARAGTLYERITFGADPRGYVARQLYRLIAQTDQSVLNQAILHEKSVAIQGLTALENLMFGPHDDASYEFRVKYIQSIAENLHVISSDFLENWQDQNGFIFTINNPGKDNPLFLNENESAMEFFKPLAGFLRFFVDVKIKDPMQASLDRVRPKYVEYWRRGYSNEVLITNLSALSDCYTEAGFSKAVAEIDPELDKRVTKGFEITTAMLTKLTRQYDQVIQDPRARKEISILIESLNAQWRLIALDVAKLLGLPIGFNEFDGD